MLCKNFLPGMIFLCMGNNRWAKPHRRFLAGWGYHTGLIFAQKPEIPGSTSQDYSWTFLREVKQLERKDFSKAIWELMAKLGQAIIGWLLHLSFCETYKIKITSRGFRKTLHWVFSKINPYEHPNRNLISGLASSATQKSNESLRWTPRRKNRVFENLMEFRIS